ncbi:hypothetical protein ASG52_19825 [Methylobacterium sp. Leaf456]|uniref:hypothetical protein n=1 Tax=Methylobacterium sp. Leaf456 TaxID=1736382 RepID=UPI0006FEBEEC|nr:hypothetical protein [Methylobacterium sp. Leaf456]KQT59977.1 hypothetical protein ASG52_19825 [Methylobacterium sp. Leaf456]
MPNAKGDLSPEEEAEIETVYVEAKAWALAAAERADPNAVASALLLVGMHVYEDSLGTVAIAELLTELAEGARAKADAGPSGKHRH